MLQVATLYNLCKALQSFHARGMVHCSLAPPSFSWFQGGQGWKVAASGDWAQAGMHVRSCYNLRYASPEVPSSCHQLNKAPALIHTVQDRHISISVVPQKMMSFGVLQQMTRQSAHIIMNMCFYMRQGQQQKPVALHSGQK